MASESKKRNYLKILLVLYFAAVHCAVIYLIYDKYILSSRRAGDVSGGFGTENVVPLPSPVDIPYRPNDLPANTASAPTPTPAPAITPFSPPPAPESGRLMIPVVGVKAASLVDTFTDARSANRVHNAIDIMAPGGTPVIAAADGEIARFFDSELGGITIYQLSADRKFVYYYAHLQKRADNLQEKTFVKQGTVIGYVGDTGNAGAGNYHLHFSISIPSDPKRYWDGTNINPYPLLKQGLESR